MPLTRRYRAETASAASRRLERPNSASALSLKADRHARTQCDLPRRSCCTTGIVRRLNPLAIFLDINSEFNFLNANLVTPAGCQLIFGTAAKKQHQRAKGGIETRKHVMLRNILFTTAVAAIVASVAMTTNATAGSSRSPQTARQYARSAAHSVPQHRRQHDARRAFARGVNDSAAHYAVPPNISLFSEPGYVNVPRLCAAQGICD
jgi:hypothetical protein